MYTYQKLITADQVHQNSAKYITGALGTQNGTLGTQNGALGYGQGQRLKLDGFSRFLVLFSGLKVH